MKSIHNEMSQAIQHQNFINISNRLRFIEQKCSDTSNLEDRF